MEEKIYLDSNASTPIDPCVLEAVIDILKNYIGNASSIHHFGQKLQKKRTSARDAVAKYLGVSPKEIFFTSGATEGLNTVIRGFFHNAPAGHIITSNVEHPCVRCAVELLEQQGCQVTRLDVGAFGAPVVDAVRQAITPQTRLITLMAVNNETGVKTDIEAIAALAEELGIAFIVDAVALLGKENFIIPPGVSAMVFSGHKIHGPQGVGAVFARRRFKFHPLLVGGEHEDGRRAGTENLSGIVGFAKAVELLQNKLPEANVFMKNLRDKFEQSLVEELGDVLINGTGPRICNTSNIAFLGVDGEALLAHLDMEGIASSHGSACASGALEPSRVLLNMGISKEIVNASIRFSVSRMTTEQEVERAVQIIVSTVKRLRGLLRK